MVNNNTQITVKNKQMNKLIKYNMFFTDPLVIIAEMLVKTGFMDQTVATIVSPHIVGMIIGTIMLYLAQVLMCVFKNLWKLVNKG